MDESGANQALCPRYGYAPKGRRCHGRAPRNRGRNTSILAALSPVGLVVTITVEGSTNTDVFLTYLDQVLCPALRPGQTVILDNLAVHKNEAVRAKIEAAGCRLCFLPASARTSIQSSTLLPSSSSSYARPKRILRKPLEIAVATGLAAITAKDACDWFKHCESATSLKRDAVENAASTAFIKCSLSAIIF